MIDPSRIPAKLADQAFSDANGDPQQAIEILTAWAVNLREFRGMDPYTVRMTATAAIIAAHPDNRKAHRG